MVRFQPDPPSVHGGLAQLGEHLLCKQGVVGSIPSSSTTFWFIEPGSGGTRVLRDAVFVIATLFKNLQEVVCHAL